MIEPLNVVPPTKPKKKTAFKSTTKKKRTVKNDESKVALSMTDLYVKENPFKAFEADTTAQASKNAEYEETSKISPDVVTFSHENGNPDTTLMSDVPESGRKLGLEDLNTAIDSTEYMDMDIPNTGNDTKVDVSVEKDPENSDVQEDVGPDVETSLGQPDNLVDDTAKIVGEKEPSFETAPEKEVNSGNTVVNSHSEVNEESEEDPKENQEEDYSEDKEKDKGVVDVDSLDSDEIPLINTFSESVAKRLRSNKGKVVTSVNKTSKTRTKTAGVGPKKGWSKVKMKTTAGSSRKRKVISSCESEYDVEKDVPNIIVSVAKKSAGKQSVQIVENVPIDKVSFHLPEFAQRWKFIHHRKLHLERELSEETMKIKVVMELIKEAGLMKTVCNIGDCYEKLVKEFLVNIPEDCDNPLSREYQKVYVRG